MRVTLMTIGSTGDVQPMLMLGRELTRRGHQVTLATTPEFHAMADTAGLAFAPVAVNAGDFMSHIMKPHAQGPAFLYQVNKSLHEAAPVILESLLEATQGSELLCCSFFGSMYYSVAEACGIPCVQLQYWPMDPTPEVPISAAPWQHLGGLWNRFSYRLGYLLITLLEKKLLTAWRKKHGLDLRRISTKPDYHIGSHTIPVIYTISEALLPRPASWPEHVRMSGCWHMEEDDGNALPAELTSFLEAGEPPIYIGFGSMNSGDMAQTYQTAINAAEACGLRAVVCTGWLGADVSLRHGSNVIVLSSPIPHRLLFPRVSAVVHHGGAGTTMAGLLAGKPALIIPFGGDQCFWADRVYRAGCSPKPIRRTRLTEPKLISALNTLISDSDMADKAEVLAKKLHAEHGVEQTADWIEAVPNHW